MADRFLAILDVEQNPLGIGRVRRRSRRQLRDDDLRIGKNSRPEKFSEAE